MSPSHVLVLIASLLEPSINHHPAHVNMLYCFSVRLEKKKMKKKNLKITILHISKFEFLVVIDTVDVNFSLVLEIVWLAALLEQ